MCSATQSRHDGSKAHNTRSSGGRGEGTDAVRRTSLYMYVPKRGIEQTLVQANISFAGMGQKVLFSSEGIQPVCR